MLQLENDLWRLEYLVNESDLGASMEQVTEMKDQLNWLMSIPSLLEQDRGTPPSGAALRSLLLPLYSRTRSMQNDLRDAVDELLDTEIDWPHPWDVEDTPSDDQPGTSSVLEEEESDESEE